MAEDVGKRTYTSKTFDNGDGTFTLDAHVGHIHYDDGGTLEDVDLRFEDMGDYWRVTKASYRLYVAKSFDGHASFANNLIRFDNKYDGANHSIYYKPHSVWWVNTDNKSDRTIWKTSQSVSGTLNADSNKITFDGAFGAGTSFEITLRRSGFSKELVLASKPPTGGAPYSNWAFGLVSRWTADNLTLSSSSGDWDELTYYEHTGELEVVEAGGFRSYIRQAWGIDSSDPVKRKELAVFFEKDAGVLWQGKLIPSSIIENATYPVRVDTVTDFDAGNGDGSVGYFYMVTPPNWSVVHGASSGPTVSYTGTMFQFMSGGDSGDSYAEIHRLFFPIYTNALPDLAIISAATFYLYYNSSVLDENDADSWITLVQTNQVSNTALESADYDQCGDSISDPTEGVDVGDRLDVTDFVTGGAKYYSLPLNATGIGWINKTGWTRLGVREGHDCLDNMPDALTRAQLRSSEYTPAGSEPYLSITYTEPIYGERGVGRGIGRGIYRGV